MLIGRFFIYLYTQKNIYSLLYNNTTEKSIVL
ncbi:hypothetical protein SAMN05444144_1129 [Flavobacterium akiainvivens]|nr:hypothetical protein SAMN05444144_1129 [Flavobacterium akiainvivens]